MEPKLGPNKVILTDEELFKACGGRTAHKYAVCNSLINKWKKKKESLSLFSGVLVMD